jgi:hypothetical protein
MISPPVVTKASSSGNEMRHVTTSPPFAGGNSQTVDWKHSELPQSLYPRLQQSYCRSQLGQLYFHQLCTPNTN